MADQQFQWLGLLKWSLQYQDGTKDSEWDELSEEKKAFLEKVMSEGVVDENVRMKQILVQFLRFLQSKTSGSAPILDAIAQLEAKSKALPSTTPTEDDLLDLLDELRDIVEQMDFALSFSQMNGLPFLLNAAAEEVVPTSVRAVCLSLLSTIAQNNPKVQEIGCECGAIEKIPSIYLSNAESSGIKAKALQALSAFVRAHEKNEKKFYACDDAVAAVKDGMSGTGQVFRRAVFFLRSLLTDDSAALDNCKRWENCIDAVVRSAHESEEVDIREICQGVILGLINKGDAFAAPVLQHVEQIKVAAARAANRCKAEPDFQHELDGWIEIMKYIKGAAEGKKVEGSSPSSHGNSKSTQEPPPLMIGSANPNPNASA